jgi:hypothetical protein
LFIRVQEDAVSFLPQLVTLESRAFLAALSRLLERRQGREALFTPAQLLVAIHGIEISAGPSPVGCFPRLPFPRGKICSIFLMFTAPLHGEYRSLVMR